MALSYTLEYQAQPIGQFTLPLKGTWKTLPAHLLPGDVLSDSLNVTIQSGELKPRAGLSLFSGYTFDANGRGATLYIGATGEKIPVMASSARFYAYIAGADWENRSHATTALGVGSTGRVRMAEIQLSGVNTLVVCTGGANVFSWAGTGNLALVSGAPSGITDICAVSTRMVGVIPPYTVRWTDALSLTGWPALNTVLLVDTPDAIVALRPLGTLGFVVYKEASIHTGFLQSATGAAAYRFEFRGIYEGPCNPDAIVDAQGVHYGFTPSGRIFRFDGTKYHYIADGLWPHIRDELNVAQKHLVHGCFNYKANEITFWYPRTQDTTGECKGMVTLVLPLPLAGIEGWPCFLGSSAFSCTASAGTVLFQDENTPLVYGDRRSFRALHTYTYDGGQEIPIVVTSGLLRQQESKIIKPIYEPYLRRGEGKTTLTLSALASNTLEKRVPETGDAQVIDLTQTPPNEYVGFETQGSFVGFKLTGYASSGFAYVGCDVYGRVTN